MIVFNAIRGGLTRFFARTTIQTRVDPNRPLALYFEPSGKVHPITMKSLTGWSSGEYNALTNSMNRSGNATASEVGFAYISEINVWVRRCIEVRSKTGARLDWYVEDKRTEQPLDNHPLTIAMNRSRHFMQRAWRSLDIWGELYVKPLKNQYDYYSDVWWLNNLSVNFDIVNGVIQQFFFAPLHGGKPYVWNASEMCYIYTENAFDDLHGSSKILAILQEANVHEEIARAAQAHYANDARPGIMFLPETDLGVPQSQEFIDYWKANFQGSWNTNKPAILPMQIKSVQTLERAVLKDDVEFRGTIRREICSAFGVPLAIAGAWDDANYDSVDTQRKSFYEDTIIPEAEQIAADLTRSLLPFFGDPATERVWFNGKNLLALAEDKQAKATALNSQLVSGGITLNQYLEAIDLQPIANGNVLYVPSSVTVTPVEKLGSMPAPAAPGGFGFHSAPPAVSVDPVAPPALPSGEEPAKAAGSMSILASLANDTGLIQLQQQVRQQMPDPSIQWTDPADFHVTLVYVPALDEPQADELVSYMEDYATDALSLNVGSLASFDKVGKHALFFRIRENAALRACQRELYTLCRDAGLAVSPFNEPSAWQPHVTMGYSAQPIRRVKVDTGLRVSPGFLVCSLEQDGQRKEVYRGAIGQPETIASVKAEAGAEGATITTAVRDVPGGTIAIGETQMVTIVPETDHFLSELSAYRKFIINRWGQPNRPFRFDFITDPLQSELVGQVKSCASKAQVNKLFDGLIEALKKTDDDPDIVTPEQAQEWWDDYDRLMKRLGNDWLRDYMREVWRRLEGRLSRDISTDDVGALLNDFHPDLIQKWTGTADEPGVIAKLFMAGMGAGQAALERKRTNMNPNKASELVLDWSLVPADAIKDVERYVKRLVGQLDKTTLKEFERVLITWLESGGTIEDLKRQLTPVFNDPDRADLIAVTEASNAYNNGAINRWQDAGVTKMKFKTVQDRKVCPQCSELAGQIGTLENGWDGVFIPVHSRCRCYASPVLD